MNATALDYHQPPPSKETKKEIESQFITYKKFMEIVPSITKEYVEKVLSNLDLTIIKNNNIRTSSIEIYNEIIKKIYSFTNPLNDIQEYSTLLGHYAYIPSRIIIIGSEVLLKKEEVFNRLSNLFLIYENESDYYSLLPLDLIANLRKSLRYNLAFIENNFQLIFPGISTSNFFEDITKKAETEKQAYKNKLELETLGMLPITTIEYIKQAINIRTELEYHFDDSDNDFINKSNIDYVPLSLLLAIYYYNSNETDKLEKILHQYNITLDEIEKFIDIYYLMDPIENSFDINILKKEYVKYYTKGICENKKQESVSITDIFANLLERNITESYIIEKILNDNYETIVQEVKENTKRQIGSNKELDPHEELNNFYKDLSNETIEFIEFSHKIYRLIKIKMLENKHNKELLLNDNDAITLSLYIANCHYNGNINKFYKEYGNVTLEQILKLINLKISKEEIESMDIKQEEMISTYCNIIYGNLNEKLNSKEIGIDEICLNICNYSFSKSLLLKKSFNKLSNLSIGNDFKSEVIKFIEEQKKQKQNELSEKFFHDMSLDTIKFLEKTSRVHQYILSQEKLWYQKDLQIVSLLTTILMQENKLTSFLKLNSNYSLNINSILEYFDIKYDKLLKNSNIDIEVLISEYQDFIFEGLNKNKNRKDITIYDIIKNIYAKELNNSIIIKKLLVEFNINYESVEEFEKAYQEYINKKKSEQIYNEAIKFICNANGSMKGYLNSASRSNLNVEYIKNTIKIHKRIVNYSKENNLTIPEENIEKISFIISLLINEEKILDKLKYFCEKNKLNLENILKYCNLDNLDLTNLEEEIDYELVLTNYKKYIEEIYDVNLLIKNMLSIKYNNSTILKEIVEHFYGNYNILEEELTTGKEHELTLTERITLLANEPITNMAIEDINSILNFGNSLSLHSKFIYYEIPKLMLSDASSKSVETINGIIDRVYTKEEQKKKSWFERIFLIEETDRKSKLSLNTEAIKELKEAINSNISILSQELLTFDKIRTYIEIYQNKNYQHLIILKETVEKLEIENSKHKEDEDNYAKLLSSSTHLKIMEEKVNRFMTTNQLMKQELFKINQIIVNHFITINALEMARDDLLPLIGSELAINLGRETENSAIELSHNVMDLFQALLTRNTENAKENMEKISSLGIDIETLQLIDKNILTYIKSIEELNAQYQPNNQKVKKLTIE